jgi:hypothetical protein
MATTGEGPSGLRSHALSPCQMKSAGVPFLPWRSCSLPCCWRTTRRLGKEE